MTATAQKCAVSAGNDCPSAFVWVHVDNLSGTALVTGVKGFNSGQDLLSSSATTYQLGWAYEPVVEDLDLRGHPRFVTRDRPRRRRYADARYG